jgi:hypothetical protein
LISERKNAQSFIIFKWSKIVEYGFSKDCGFLKECKSKKCGKFYNNFTKLFSIQHFRIILWNLLPTVSPGSLNFCPLV